MLCLQRRHIVLTQAIGLESENKRSLDILERKITEIHKSRTRTFRPGMRKNLRGSLPSCLQSTTVVDNHPQMIRVMTVRRTSYSLKGGQIVLSEAELGPEVSKRLLNQVCPLQTEDCKGDISTISTSKVLTLVRSSKRHSRQQAVMIA